MQYSYQQFDKQEWIEYFYLPVKITLPYAYKYMPIRRDCLCWQNTKDLCLYIQRLNKVLQALHNLKIAKMTLVLTQHILQPDHLLGKIFTFFQVLPFDLVHVFYHVFSSFWFSPCILSCIFLLSSYFSVVLVLELLMCSKFTKTCRRICLFHCWF